MRDRREGQGPRLGVARYPSNRNAGLPSEAHAFLRQARLADPGPAGQQNPARLALAESPAYGPQLTNAAEERLRLAQSGGAGLDVGGLSRSEERRRPDTDVAGRFALRFDMGHKAVAARMDRANDVLVLTGVPNSTTFRYRRPPLGAPTPWYVACHAPLSWPPTRNGILGCVAKYDPLFEHLCRAGDGAVEMTFTDIDRLVGGLPTSATRHAPWWSNDQHGPHVQAKAWLEAGREVEWVDRDAGRVRFSAPKWRRGA